jgi:hypothetical protein
VLLGLGLIHLSLDGEDDRCAGGGFGDGGEQPFSSSAACGSDAQVWGAQEPQQHGSQQQHTLLRGSRGTFPG